MWLNNNAGIYGLIFYFVNICRLHIYFSTFRPKCQLFVEADRNSVSKGNCCFSNKELIKTVLFLCLSHFNSVPASSDFVVC